MRFLSCCCFAVVLLSQPTAVLAQSAEFEDVEVINPSDTNPRRFGNAEVSQVAKIIVEHTNAFRKQMDREAVSRDLKLDKAAEYFASYMAKNDKYGHTADGNRPSQRAKKFGYQYCIVSENIAYQYKTNDFATQKLGEKFVVGWKNSPGHRKNMLDSDVTETGVAVVQSKDSGYYYAVQMFGRPKSKQIEFSLLNKTGADVKYKIGDQHFTLPPRYKRTHVRCRPPVLHYPPSLKDNSALNRKIEPMNRSHYIVESMGSEGLRIREK